MKIDWGQKKPISFGELNRLSKANNSFVFNRRFGQGRWSNG